MACEGDGVWRHDWIEKREGNATVSQRKALGLIMAEAFTRCPPADEAERDLLTQAFTAIEQGACMGSLKGCETEAERAEEEG